MDLLHGQERFVPNYSSFVVFRPSLVYLPSTATRASTRYRPWQRGDYLNIGGYTMVKSNLVELVPEGQRTFYYQNDWKDD